MVDPLHYQFLLGTLGKATGHRLWLEFKLKTHWIDLSTADFTDHDLRGYNLSDTNLSTAILLDADLAGCDLSDSRLEFSDLRNANLRNAILDRANLNHANLQNATLVDAACEGANLKGARLNGATLVGTDFAGADLRGADLRGASLKFSTLKGATLDGADVADADLTGAVMDDDAPRRMVNFKRAKIDDRAYRESRLRGIQFERPLVTLEDETTVPPPGAAAGSAPGVEWAAETPKPAKKPKKEKKPKSVAAQIPVREVEPDLTTVEGCCLVLELPCDASTAQIVKAFRAKAKLYHPDMVRHLSPRLQELAAEEFHRLHQAYERLTRGTTRPLTGIRWAEGVPRRASPYEYTCEEYEALARVNPANLNILYNLAWKYFEEGRHRDALSGFHRVLALDPGDVDAQYNVMIVRLCIEFEVPGPAMIDSPDAAK